MPTASPLSYHIAITAGGRSEPGGSAHIHIGASFYAREDHKVGTFIAASEQLANDQR